MREGSDVSGYSWPGGWLNTAAFPSPTAAQISLLSGWEMHLSVVLLLYPHFSTREKGIFPTVPVSYHSGEEH